MNGFLARQVVVEVARLLKDKQNCSLKAVLVAPDVEADRKTVRGSLDDRLNDLIKQAEGIVRQAEMIEAM